ncbi:RNB domain-containing ribonuclease [Agromyces sp. CCNWLW203]|uniref:RNB domain-containing ribonuclease n=1 Tax=Agromyces sp. CCNWLW203 TaxID=3112842 RepID=UPI002F9698AC
MPSRRTHVTDSVAQSELAVALARLRAELDVPESFPPEVLAEAASMRAADPGTDLGELEFVTIDPPGSTDLDQALCIARRASGFLVHYAIADVPGWVLPDGAVDLEARRRGQTLYAADGRVPLHPVVLSEDRVSLLPDAERTAFVWVFELDERGEVTSTGLVRANVRSREQLSYDEAQARIDAGDGDSSLALVREVGLLRIELERARGGASLNSPVEEIVRTADGGYSLERRRPLPVEDWNAQLSLMTGMEAAKLMLAAGVGVLRTMPKPSAERITTFREQTRALGLPWTETISYGEYLRGLDRDDPAALAVMQAASGLFRGAGYLAVDGEFPPDPIQSALAAPYAHVTAPLRRLVDRWGLAICEAICGKREVPVWARASLPELPSLMGASSQRAGRLEAESIARVEAALLSSRAGERFSATVLEVRGERAWLQIAEPAVTATCPAPADVHAGTSLEVELIAADIATGTIEFRVVAGAAA